MTPKQRRAYLESIPWIKRLKIALPCDGFRYSKMPLKAIYPHGPKRSLPPTGTDQYRCKSIAYWKFKALKRSGAEDGVYCMSHLYNQMSHMGEYERVNRWITRKYGSWEACREHMRSIV